MKRAFIIAAVFLLSAVLSGCTATRGNSASSGGKAALRVMAAASLTEPLNEIAHEYEIQNPDVQLELNFANTQALVSQIEQGVGADVFLSANKKYMDEMQHKGYVGDYAMFVTNKLVAAVYREADISSLEDLAKPGIKLAVTDETAPIGEYTMEMLGKIEASGKFSAGYKGKFLANVRSREMDVKALVSKIQLGEVDAGIVYGTDVASGSQSIKTVEIPPEYNCVAQVPVAVLNGSGQQEEAEAFVAYLLSDAGITIMEKYGFNAATE